MNEVRARERQRRSKARRLFRRLYPAAVVGFGGYPSVPTLLAAHRIKLPTVLHEQNAVLGRANRFLARHADLVALSFAATEGVRIGTATIATSGVSGRSATEG